MLQLHWLIKNCIIQIIFIQNTSTISSSPQESKWSSKVLKENKKCNLWGLLYHTYYL